MTRGGRIGVFGGSFDPPHIGHLVVAQDVYEALSLDLLLIVPAARPPHRDPALRPEERLELARLAFGADPRFEVSGIELAREGPSWTVETLAEIRAAREAADLLLVIGVDQYRGFGGWREPERILELARLAVMPRDGEAPVPDPRFPFEAVPVTRVDVSGTRIRQRLDAGLTTRYLVPESIRERLEELWIERTGARVSGAAPGGAPDMRPSEDRC